MSNFYRLLQRRSKYSLATLMQRVSATCHNCVLFTCNQRTLCTTNQRSLCTGIQRIIITWKVVHVNHAYATRTQRRSRTLIQRWINVALSAVKTSSWWWSMEFCYIFLCCFMLLQFAYARALFCFSLFFYILFCSVLVFFVLFQFFQFLILFF